MKRHHTCRTCGHFRPGAVADMRQPSPIDSDDELGVCEALPPIPVQGGVKGFMVGHQPLVHASRSCVDYIPHADWDGTDDPASQAKVRHLRPVHGSAA